MGGDDVDLVLAKSRIIGGTMHATWVVPQCVIDREEVPSSFVRGCFIPVARLEHGNITSLPQYISFFYELITS